MPAFKRLKGTMIGRIIWITALRGVPIKIGVNAMLNIHIISIIAIVPIIKPMMALFLLLFLQYKEPDNNAKVPVAKMCMIIPIIPLPALTVVP